MKTIPTRSSYIQMGCLLCLAFLSANCTSKPTQSAPASGATTAPGTLSSRVVNWSDMVAESKPSGQRRGVLAGRTATLDDLEVHITTLNPGERPHLPHRHPWEELMLVKEGTLEATLNGQVLTLPAGSVLYVAPNDFHGLRNIGTTQATYFVLIWKTPLTAPGKSTTQPAN